MVYGASALYSVFLWRKGFQRDDRANYLLLLGGFGFHTAAMLRRGMTLSHCPVQNLYEATTFVAWSLALAFLVVGAWRRMRFLGALASPVLCCLGVFALMPALDAPHGPRPEFGGALQSLHAALSLLAYGAFGLAAVSAVMYLTQEHNLRFDKLRAVLSRLPPIQRLELTTRRLALVGFMLFTVGLYLGRHLPRPEGVRFMQDPKVIWSVALWLVYLGLLVWRGRGGSSRRFAWGIAGVFVFALLTFWGTNLLSPLHHP